MATIPTNPKQFIEHCKMLTEEDIKNLQHPLLLTKLENEWIKIHDRYGHMSFTAMDKLVANNI